MKLSLQTKFAFLGLAFFLTILAFFSFNFSVKASAPSGLQATIATSSQATVGTAPSLVIATSTCSARVISTQGSAIMITFSDIQGAQPSAISGAVQPASTTVAYDSGLYGCGAVRVYSFAAQSINVIDSR